MKKLILLRQITLLIALVLITSRPSVTAAETTALSSISAACKTTLYPEACTSAFASTLVEGNGPAKSPTELFNLSVQFAMSRVHLARSLAYNLTFLKNDATVYPPTGTYDCIELLDNTLELLSDAVDGRRKDTRNEDVETWLSAALTNQVTCRESLATRPPTKKELIDYEAANLTQFISNSLALHKFATKGQVKLDHNVGGRKLLSDAFPSWLSKKDRELLQVSPEDIVPNAVVAKDGSGTHTSINEALAFVSLAGSGGGRTVIYVKAGTYNEYIRVATKQKNVMLMGEGKGVSVIVGNRNNAGGWSTYNSATVAGDGEGLICKDLTIINNSGPEKGQAVALRVSADRSVIYRCSIQGYQDTLYTHSNRQFYAENDIYGTVDFIFGNSAAVFQSCNISPRSGHASSITAQSRQDPNQNTGISIQNCRIAAASDLAPVKGSVQTFFGRPWRPYSRVVVMQSYIDDSIHPAGWKSWSGDTSGSGLLSVYYGEYGNSGPGASTSRRVRSAGVHSSMSTAEASKFTVANFIYGNLWIPGTGINYKAGL